MDPEQYRALKDYLTELEEVELWELLEEYFAVRKVDVGIVHAPSEHGTDVLVHVSQENDFLGQGYNILIQTKIGDLNLRRCREVLCQMFEMPYITLRHPVFHDAFPRRIVLVITGRVLAEARASLTEFNSHHDFDIEVIDLNGLVRLLDLKTGYVSDLIARSLGVGQAQTEYEEMEPPVVGRAEPPADDEAL